MIQGFSSKTQMSSPSPGETLIYGMSGNNRYVRCLMSCITQKSRELCALLLATKTCQEILHFKLSCSRGFTVPRRQESCIRRSRFMVQIQREIYIFCARRPLLWVFLQQEQDNFGFTILIFNHLFKAVLQRIIKKYQRAISSQQGE